MSVAAIKAAVVALVEGAVTGQVATYPGAVLEAEGTGDFSGVFVSVTRNGVYQASRTIGGKADRVHQMDIDVYLPLPLTGMEASAAEEAFDSLVDGILDALWRDPTLGGLVMKSGPPSALEDATGVRLYRGVALCRYRRIRWEVTESVPA